MHTQNVFLFDVSSWAQTPNRPPKNPIDWQENVQVIG